MGTARIALVLPSFAGGGAEKVMVALAAGLDRHRFSTSIVAFSSDGPLRDTVPDDVEVIDLNRPRLRAALPALFTTLRARRFDLVLTTMGYVNMGVLLGGRVGAGGARIIVREANAPSATTARLPVPGLARLGYRTLYRRAAAVVCNATAVKADLAGLGVPEAHIHLIPNPVDIDGLRHGVSVSRQPGPGRRFVAAGRLTHQKGFDRLIGLMRDGPADDRLTILGDGPLRAELEASIDRLGLSDRVRLPGFVPDPAPLIAGADAFLMPSRWEGLPNAALEALALGTPVIASATAGGLSDLAGEVPADALSIAGSAEEFAAIAGAVLPTPDIDGPRPCVLPNRFSKQHVIAAYEALIDASLT